MDFEGKIRRDGLEPFGRFYGTYIGVVKDIEDPKELGRLLLYIPEVMGPSGPLRWAYPRGIFQGMGFGMQFIPQVEDFVYVSYRNGDPLNPLWDYGPRRKESKPEEFQDLTTSGFVTPGGIKILLRDEEDKSVTISTPGGNQITIEDASNTISLENADGVSLKVTGKEITAGPDNHHLTNSDELKDILTSLQGHLVAYSTVLQGLGASPIGATSPTPDIGLTQWLQSLEKIITKYS